jgi:hypothetical protein
MTRVVTSCARGSRSRGPATHRWTRYHLRNPRLGLLALAVDERPTTRRTLSPRVDPTRKRMARSRATSSTSQVSEANRRPRQLPSRTSPATSCPCSRRVPSAPTTGGVRRLPSSRMRSSRARQGIWSNRPPPTRKHMVMAMSPMARIPRNGSGLACARTSARAMYFLRRAPFFPRRTLRLQTPVARLWSLGRSPRPLPQQMSLLPWTRRRREGAPSLSCVTRRLGHPRSELKLVLIIFLC